MEKIIKMPHNIFFPKNPNVAKRLRNAIYNRLAILNNLNNEPEGFESSGSQASFLPLFSNSSASLGQMLESTVDEHFEGDVSEGDLDAETGDGINAAVKLSNSTAVERKEESENECEHEDNSPDEEEDLPQSNANGDEVENDEEKEYEDEHEVREDIDIYERRPASLNKFTRNK